MTDKEKLDAIRAEIHRLVDVRGYDREMANDLFAFMDSLPNEPVSEDLEEVVKDIFKNIEPDAYHTINQGSLNEREEPAWSEELVLTAIKAGIKWQRQKETILVGEDLEEAARKECRGLTDPQEIIDCYCQFIRGANWQKQQMVKNAVNGFICETKE